MEKIILTPQDQAFLDPTGRARDKLKRIPRNKDFFAEPSIHFNDTEKVWLKYTQRLEHFCNAPKHKPYYGYLDEMMSKIGPQGGSYSFYTMDAKVQEYYTCAHNTRHISPILIQGRDYLIRLIKQELSKDRVIIPDFLTYKDTYAGLPSGGTKGSYYAETLGAKPWRHMYPCVPGQRRMRGKDRVIFQDSVLNVRYIEKELTACRNWLKTRLPRLFNAWLNPREYTAPLLTKAVDRRFSFLETDYQSMDIHFSLTVVNELILPIYEVLIPDAFLSFACAVNELFHQPVYLGAYIYIGLHNLFSGEVITNDFETIYTVILALGTAIHYDLLSDLEMCVLGDDCTLALPSKLSYNRLADIMQFMKDVSDQADMIIHDIGKSRIAQGETRFCRKVYYPSGTRDANGVLLGAYPSNLCLNNILRPESPISLPGVAAIADLSRLDNVYGVPEYVELVQLVYRYTTHKFKYALEDLNNFSKRRDWWKDLYGESWNPDSSPTLSLITKMSK